MDDINYSHCVRGLTSCTRCGYEFEVSVHIDEEMVWLPEKCHSCDCEISGEDKFAMEARAFHNARYNRTIKKAKEIIEKSKSNKASRFLAFLGRENLTKADYLELAWKCLECSGFKEDYVSIEVSMRSIESVFESEREKEEKGQKRSDCEICHGTGWIKSCHEEACPFCK